ncbi:MAG: bifunctional pantoate--beta-alanine ligase/(d)CMP kinase [Cyanobacteria bacterium P01_F01_bin.42]
MFLFRTPEGLQAFLSSFSSSWQNDQETTASIGLVPTMGALHAGHMSLIERARRDDDCTVVSIFVNPLQFGPGEDFDAYPRDLEVDLDACRAAKVDAVFAPSADVIYGDEDSCQVSPPEAMIRELCGRSRPGHFAGVATVVTKLLNIVQPTRAYFGQKDAQQLAIIRRLVQDLNLRTQIVGCSIYREASGLAMSSRNQYLSESETQLASQLYQSLRNAEATFRQGDRAVSSLQAAVREYLSDYPAIKLEYVEIVEPEKLTPLSHVESRGLIAIAARIGSTRLIDNLILDGRRPILAIDGPAGAGKSTVTRQCAKKLGLLYLDTGAMYRSVTWFVQHSGVALDDEAAIADLLPRFKLELKPNPDVGQEVWVNGEDVTQAIRSPEVTAAVSGIAAQAAVRRALVDQQQRFGVLGGVAAEGRDIGTNVFPNARVKIFLTASIEERAQRRFLELEAKGEFEVSYDDLVQQIAERDRKDSQRAIAPLKQAADAIQILTDGLTIEQVCDRIIQIFQEAADEE